jgi:hypothetical protein
MPPKPKTTGTRNAKRDILAFFVDASQKNSTVGDAFLKVLQKKKLTAIDIYKFFVGEGYVDVQEEEVTNLFKVYKAKGPVKDALMSMGY